jgi:protein-S-isoprenylcysteine O-methyltransferase Ste14
MQDRGTTHRFDATIRLIEDDVFGYSRNPMYLGMTAILLGAALALRNLASLAAPLYFFLVIDLVFAPFEEAKMEHEIGEPFLAYKKKVRRWF